MVRRILVALVLTLALGAFAGPSTLSAAAPEFACGDEEKGEEPEDSTLQLG